MPRQKIVPDADNDNPWSRPGWIVSVGFLAMIVVLGLTAIVLHPRREDASTSTVSRPSAPARPTVPAPPETNCDLAATAGGAAGDAALKINVADTKWLYEGASSYPVSTVYGPARTAPEGFRYCFQHSAGGALFAAANTVALSLPTATASAEWADYIIADGPYREQLLAAEDRQQDQTIRMTITGFRVLEYDGATAKIDLAVSATTIDESVVLSIVFDLVWQHDDWRYTAQAPEPLSISRASEVSHYTEWGAP